MKLKYNIGDVVENTTSLGTVKVLDYFSSPVTGLHVYKVIDEDDYEMYVTEEEINDKIV